MLAPRVEALLSDLHVSFFSAPHGSGVAVHQCGQDTLVHHMQQASGSIDATCSAVTPYQHEALQLKGPQRADSRVAVSNEISKQKPHGRIQALRLVVTLV